MDISFNSDRLKMSSGLPSLLASFLASLAGAFSSGASAVAVVVAPLSPPLAAVLLALEERVRGVRCDILVLLSRLAPNLRCAAHFASFLTAQMAALFIVK